MSHDIPYGHNKPIIITFLAMKKVLELFNIITKLNGDWFMNNTKINTL